MRSDEAEDPARAASRWPRIAGGLAGLCVVVAVYLLLYAPQPTTLPSVYNDDLILMQAAESYARDGTLTFPINSSPFDDPRVIGSAEKTRAVLEEGYFIAMGLWLRARGATVTEARRFSAAAGLVLLVTVYGLLCMLASPPLAAAACLLTLLDNSFWTCARTVRPDLPTAALAMLSLLLMLAARRAGGSLALLFASGLAMGGASTMHPNWMLYIVPWLGTFALTRPARPVHGFAAFMAGALLVFTPYAVDVAQHWSEATKTLAEHQAHNAALEGASRAPVLRQAHWLWSNLAAEPNRYRAAAGYDFNKPTRDAMLILALAALAWLLARLLTARRKAPSAPRFAVRVCLTVCLPIMAALAILVTYKVPLYLVHVLPWLGFATALAVADIATLAARAVSLSPAAAARAGICVVCIAVATYTFVTVPAYTTVFRAYDDARVISYEDATALLAREMPPDAVLFSTPNGWPLALKSDAIFFSNQMLPYQQVDLPGFPWQVEADGTHLRSYRLDVARMRALQRNARRPVYLLVDESDWAWNGFYPFGRTYGASYSELQTDLARWFRPVAQVITGPRGVMGLYRFEDGLRPPSSPSWPASWPTWVEGERVEGRPQTICTLDDLRRAIGQTSGAVVLRARDAGQPFVHLEGVRGALLRLTLTGRCRGGAAVYPFVSGDTASAWNVLRFLDAAEPIRYPLYRRIHADSADISLRFATPDGEAEIDDLRIDVIPSSGQHVTATPRAHAAP